MKTLRIIAPLALLLAACGGNPMMDEATGENSGKGGAGAAAAGGAGGTSAGTGGALGDQQGGASGAATGGAPAGTGGASAEGGQGGHETTGGAGGAGGVAGAGGAAVTGGAGPGETGGAGAGSGGAGGTGGMDPAVLTCPQTVPATEAQSRCGVLLGPNNFDSRWKDGLECAICTRSGRQVTGCSLDEGMGDEVVCVMTCNLCCYKTPGRGCETDADCCAPMTCKANPSGAGKVCG